jgi:hypothetical protein
LAIPRVLERETDDWLYIPITQNGVAYTGAWSYQIVAFDARPVGSWLTAVPNGGLKGIDVQGLAVGSYDVFIRIDGQGNYAPVFKTDPLVVQ